MAVQDDRRENEQRELFELDVADDRSRDGVDALLEIGGEICEFELKSTTKKTVTTVRDFGMDHIEKWKTKHWLFGFYTPQGNALRYTRYASPKMMEPWISEKKQYIQPDFAIGKLAAKRLNLSDLFEVCGEKHVYSYEDAKSLLKNQLKKVEYYHLQDVEGGYSQDRMLGLLRQRSVYVSNRGSTLNNPHIPVPVLESLPKITSDHAATLRELVTQSLKS